MTFKNSAPIQNLFRKHPKLADEVRQLASTGQLPGVDPSRITKETMEQFLDPSATTSAPRTNGFESLQPGPSPVDRHAAELLDLELEILPPELRLLKFALERRETLRNFVACCPEFGVLFLEFLISLHHTRAHGAS